MIFLSTVQFFLPLLAATINFVGGIQFFFTFMLQKSGWFILVVFVYTVSRWIDRPTKNNSKHFS